MTNLFLKSSTMFYNSITKIFKVMPKIILIILFNNAFAVVNISNAFANTNISFDLSLIRRWDQNFYNQHKYQPFPNTILFRLGHKNIVYVATKHKNWKDTQIQIKHAIYQLNPDIILIEGIAKEDGISPHIWDDKIKQNLNAEGFEDYYAYKLALEKKIPFVGAELPGKMSEHTSYDRDISVLTYLSDLLSRYNTVLIIYGAGHFVQQEPALIKTLGPSKIISKNIN